MRPRLTHFSRVCMLTFVNGGNANPHGFSSLQLVSVFWTPASALHFVRREWLFFDAVLHLPAATIQFLVQRLGLDLLSEQRGHHESRVSSLIQMLGLGHHAPLAFPANISRRISRCNVTKPSSC